jgi:hypothetical protein
MSDDRSVIHQSAREEVLRRCYHVVDRENPTCSQDIADEYGLPYDEFLRKIYEPLYAEGLVYRGAGGCEAGKRGFSIWLQPAGVLKAEELRLVDPERAKAHELAREYVLRSLGSLHRQGGVFPRLARNQFDAPEHPSWAVDRAISLLESCGAIERDHLGLAFIVTADGLRMLCALEQREELANELARIEGLPARKRGKELEGIIPRALRLQDCHCEEDAGAVGEQVDQVVQCGSAYFVCDSKWEKKPVGGAFVAQMAGRMLRRPASYIGVIYSISGFTAGAVEAASSLASHRVILLVPGDDVRAIIAGERHFMDVVQEQQMSLAKQARL